IAREDRPGERRLVAYIVPTNDQRPTTNDQRQGDKETRREGDDDESGTQHSTLNTQNFSSILHPPSSILQELRAYLQAQLPGYMVPSAIVPLQALPLNPNGKVDRRALPAPAAPRPAAELDGAPATPTEELLVAIWSAVLGLPHLSVHANFFDLGGHSLLATQV